MWKQNVMLYLVHYSLQCVHHKRICILVISNSLMSYRQVSSDSEWQRIGQSKQSTAFIDKGRGIYIVESHVGVHSAQLALRCVGTWFALFLEAESEVWVRQIIVTCFQIRIFAATSIKAGTFAIRITVSVNCYLQPVYVICSRTPLPTEYTDQQQLSFAKRKFTYWYYN